MLILLQTYSVPLLLTYYCSEDFFFHLPAVDSGKMPNSMSLTDVCVVQTGVPYPAGSCSLFYQALVFWVSIFMMRYRKFLCWSRKKYRPTFFEFVCHPLQNSPLENVHSDLSISFTPHKHCRSPFPEGHSIPATIPFGFHLWC